ncbi:MAG: M67 family metallopeptidase [Chloroflexi bacterium]|nr:MAG: M67 family metallopeptidase [Chloroflexota bacterium]
MSIAEATCTADAHARIRELATAAYPDEGCGVMVGRVEGTAVVIERVTSARNLNVERARDRYDLDPADIVRADREARAEGLDIVGFWHSHPDHPAWPSQFDTDRAWVDYVYIVTATTSAGAADVNAFTLRDERGSFDRIPLSTKPATAGRR